MRSAASSLQPVHFFVKKRGNFLLQIYNTKLIVFTKGGLMSKLRESSVFGFTKGTCNPTLPRVNTFMFGGR